MSPTSSHSPEPSPEYFLELRGLAKSFGDTTVLEDLSLGIREGEMLALLGLSGSGKTTALRILAGFETPDAGRVVLGREDLLRKPPAKRGVGMVFQHYALFPHMTVAENVAFGLESRGRAGGWGREKTAERVREMLRLVDLEGFEERRPGEISGGQQQRIAVARALAPEPRLLLLDEPLSNLDPSLRERTRAELKQAVERVGITTVLVTHEQEEAFHLGDRVAVLHRGRMEQVGTPFELYRRPATRFVAGFVGRSSSLRGTVTETRGDRAWVRIGDDPKSGEEIRWWGRLGACIAPVERGDEVDLVIRPESLVEVGPSERGALHGTVVGIRFTGPLTLARVDLDGGLGRLEVRVEGEEDPTGRRFRLIPRADGPPPVLFPVAADGGERSP